MPMGYQPPKFQQFDGKGNPKQHVAHFVETCNNAGTYGDHLVKQLIRSLKGNAFDCMVELINSRQWKEEPVVDYINRHALGTMLHVSCNKTKIFEELATRAHGIEMSFNCKEMNIQLIPMMMMVMQHHEI
ncbi:hypothetical protein Sango_0683800 [Sesamum angolense]|uniref:Retrotransposon gag protein n=1 Tax=Sesamum angolense TaxID=2727404 RepID=A0AAE2C2Q2_9LAMI|nr:hypothetical protein Sango_0683800 [Sesamum angolense]